MVQNLILNNSCFFDIFVKWLFDLLDPQKKPQECSAQPENFFGTSACSRTSKFHIDVLKKWSEHGDIFLVWLILKKSEKKFHPKRYLKGHFHQYISPIWSLRPSYPFFCPRTKSASKHEQCCIVYFINRNHELPRWNRIRII